MTDKKTTLRSMRTYHAGLIQARAYRNISEFMDNNLDSFGLSMPEWSFLGTLHDKGSSNLKDLASILDVAPPFATRICGRLERKNMVNKEANPKDARGRCVELTSGGHQLVNVVEQHTRASMKDLLHDVDMEDLEAYMRVLLKLSNLPGK